MVAPKISAKRVCCADLGIKTQSKKNLNIFFGNPNKSKLRCTAFYLSMYIMKSKLLGRKIKLG